MRRKLSRLLVGGGVLALAALGTAAHARGNVHWSVGVHAAPGVTVGVGNVGPLFIPPAPIYVAPAPVYVPPPMYYQQPGYYQQPVYYVQPAPVYYGHPGKHRGHHHNHRHHRQHGWRH